MHFNVGNLSYSVVLVRGYIRYEDRLCLGLSDFDTQTVYISDVPEPVARLQTLIHEVMECWIHHCGLPAEKEQVCDFVGTAMSQIIVPLIGNASTLQAILGRGAKVDPREPIRARQTDTLANGRMQRVTVIEPLQ